MQMSKPFVMPLVLDDRNHQQRSFDVTKPGKSDEPECLSIDDAIDAVRSCLQKIVGGGAGNILMDTKISDILPGDSDQIGLRRLLACIRSTTKFNLNPDELADGSLQDIADKLTCD